MIIAILALATLNGAAQALTFETCTPENSYLESSLIPPSTSPAGDVAAIPPVCIAAAHVSLAPTGYYGYCPTSSGKPSRSHPRPCISPNYVGIVHEALVNVTSCLSYDSRLAFATFNLESALHLVAVGRALDVGVGQLTKIAIDEVNMNALPAAKRAALRSDNPSCQEILPNMTEHSSHIDERCGFMSVPENPTRNIVYSILLLKRNLQIINNLWTRQKISLPAAIDQDLLKGNLVKLAYNAGPAGLVSSLKAYADQMGDRKFRRR
jgi:hypothetical protein